MNIIKGPLSIIKMAIGGEFNLENYHDFVGRDPYINMGWDAGEGDAPIGSLWSVEGRLLYGLVRAAQPSSVVELGTHAGASACHIAAALKENGSGRLTSVDNGSHAQPVEIGHLVPDDLQKFVTFREADGIEYLKSRKRVDFIFEDMLHTYEQAFGVARLAQEKLSDGGFLVVHDAAHFIVGEQVRAGLADAGLEPLVVLSEPSDCGMAIWRK